MGGNPLQHLAGRSLRVVVLLGLAALCVLLLANAYVRYRATQQLEDASHWVEHTLAVDSQLEVVGSRLRDAETGQRGYLLTGETNYLEPYNAAVQRLPADLKTLGEMTSDNREQAKNVERLKQLCETKLSELRLTVELFQQGRPDDARAIVRSNVGQHTMEEIRNVLARMDASESALLAQRKQSLENVELKERIALVLGVGIGLLATISFGWALYRIELVRDRAETVIRENEEWLATTLGSIGDAVIATDAKGNVQFLNPVAQELTHFTQASAKGRPLSDVLPIFNETTREITESPVEKAIATGKVVGLANHTILIRADGSEIAIDDSAAPILDRSGKITGVVLVFRDVSKERQVERAMRTSEKLAAAGKLAATVAHEINNPLEAAANLLYLLRDEASISAEGSQYLKLAEEQLARVAHITKQTLAFYRDPRRPELLQLSAVCERILELYRPRFKNKALAVRSEYEKDLTVFATEGEVAQVISNLVSNAIDASEPEGEVIVRVARGNDHQGVISVTDTGCGISVHDAAKIFEPFFTTKKDVGTGLGLWVSKEIVEKLGGTIEVNSAGEDQGATFSVSLPLHDTQNLNSSGDAR
jgi:PAS domain S-box-containing protein